MDAQDSSNIPDIRNVLYDVLGLQGYKSAAAAEYIIQSNVKTNGGYCVIRTWYWWYQLLVYPCRTCGVPSFIYPSLRLGLGMN